MPAPLLKIGTFGTHAIEVDGIWSFSGTVPRNIKRGGYPTEQSAIEAFAEWFTRQDAQFHRDHIDNLRDDVLKFVDFPLMQPRIDG